MSRTVPFTKMHGAGNDFIMLDGRRLRAAGVTLDRARIARWCARRLGIGADGLIVVDADPDPAVDFRMTYFNSDGGEASLCGNGARCCFAFARAVGLAGDSARFRTAAGVVGAAAAGDDVRVELPPPGEVRLDLPLAAAHPFGAVHLADTGVPHLVIPVANVEEVDVPRWGPRLRGDPALGPAGANVDWVQPLAGGTFLIRTYERGVEAETLACGTGAAAAALVLVRLGRAASPVTLLTRAGYRLTIDVAAAAGGHRLRLTGPVATVFQGEVPVDD